MKPLYGIKHTKVHHKLNGRTYCGSAFFSNSKNTVIVYNRSLKKRGKNRLKQQLIEMLNESI